MPPGASRVVRTSAVASCAGGCSSLAAGALWPGASPYHAPPAPPASTTATSPIQTRLLRLTGPPTSGRGGAFCVAVDTG